MFFDVTTMVAAVAVVLAITAATTAAMSALFTDDPSLRMTPLWPQVMRWQRRMSSNVGGRAPSRTPWALPATPPSRTHKTSACRVSSGTALTARAGCPAAVVVMDANHLQRPARAERDAWPRRLRHGV